MTKFAKSNPGHSINKIIICIYDTKGFDKFNNAWEAHEEAKQSDSDSDGGIAKKPGK